MKVYVLETGCYEDRYIHGVYSTPELAMAAWQPTRPAPDPRPWRDDTTQTYQWAADDPGHGWYFLADWDDAATVTEYELDATSAR